MARTLFGLEIRSVRRWRRIRAVQNGVTIGLVLLGPILAVLTAMVISGPLEGGTNATSLRLILLADIIYVLLIAALVIQRVTRLAIARRNRSAGSQLHLRLTGAFVLLALIPTVLVAVFALLSINMGFEGWFSNRVSTVLGTSLDTAEAYKAEERNELERDGRALAAYLNNERSTNFFMDDGDVRQAIQIVQGQVNRGLTEVFFIDGAGTIRTRGAGSYEFNFEKPSPELFAMADESGIVIIEDSTQNEFRALLSMTNFPDRYLLVTREVDGSILSLLDETQETVAVYNQLEQDRGRLLFGFGFIYLGFAVILILAATWLGLLFAERLSRPVGRLVDASQRVGAGDLDVRVIEEEGDDEIAQLGTYFNQMTSRLKGQRDELVETNTKTERRRRLFDSVLSSVTSGVVGLDPDGRITFLNPSAQAMLAVGGEQADVALSVAIPEFTPMFERLVSEGREATQGQINLIRKGQQESLLVRMAPRLNEEGTLEGYVVAFDDVTDLVSAQRMAAWGDVARRIAHEIKNPLTPIQLSAERIKRKFGSEVVDVDRLDQMTDVIVRQTNDLRRIVDEFSKFARMPEPELKSVDLTKIVRDAVTLQEAGQPEVKIVASIPNAPIIADLDCTMISQALTNLIKNAGEAIETYIEKEGQDVVPEVRVALSMENDTAFVTVEDNGIGLPEDRAKLFEPYVTTRDKGTGLGLPIVKKIIEEHGGTLTLSNAEPFDESGRVGAKATIKLPLATAVANKIPA
ncbi:ATP-binding protein [Cognatiyoonia sp.]|uniref:sensor histidine kinase NtrY-like n=1 Tax=Cognatiyoonia sp. TaxID=2211652 RepID=UPI003F6A33F2